MSDHKMVAFQFSIHVFPGATSSGWHTSAARLWASSCVSYSVAFCFCSAIIVSAFIDLLSVYISCDCCDGLCGLCNYVIFSHCFCYLIQQVATSDSGSAGVLRNSRQLDKASNVGRRTTHGPVHIQETDSFDWEKRRLFW